MSFPPLEFDNDTGSARTTNDSDNTFSSTLASPTTSTTTTNTTLTTTTTTNTNSTIAMGMSSPLQTITNSSEKKKTEDNVRAVLKCRANVFVIIIFIIICNA